MNTNVKYLIGVLVFFLCLCVGFFLTKSTKSLISQNNGNDTIIDNPIIEEPDSIDTLQVQKEVSTQVLEISSTDVQKMGDSYSLQITCTNVPANVILSYEVPSLRLKNLDGYFTRIPGCESGSYKVNVINSATGEILVSKVVSGFKLKKEKPVDPMSSVEFQSLLLNQSDNSLLGGQHPKVAKSIALSFEGLRDDDRKPSDILAIRDKINFGIWSSAKVLRVGYDEKGKINSVRIQPVY